MFRIAMTLILLLSAPIAAAAAETITVAAAISMKDALTDVARQYESDTGHTIKFTFGSSGQLAAQVKAGAPIDVFISAAEKQVDDAIATGAADKSTKTVVAGNELVLIAPPGDRAKPLFFDQLADAEIKRIAIGDPATVPAGQYAKQTLEHLKLWPRVEKRLVYGTNVRAVLDLVINHEVQAALVYRTDALEAGDKVRVRVVAAADPKSHDPIKYVAVTTKRASTPAADGFSKYLTSEKAQSTLEKFGFTAPRQK
jgi:molybdate transport system substrate-binding protein